MSVERCRTIAAISIVYDGLVGITMLAVFAVVLLLEIVCLLVAGDAAEIDKLLGPRGYQEETQEALEAVGLVPARSGDGRDAQQ